MRAKTEQEQNKGQGDISNQREERQGLKRTNRQHKNAKVNTERMRERERKREREGGRGWERVKKEKRG